MAQTVMLSITFVHFLFQVLTKLSLYINTFQEVVRQHINHSRHSDATGLSGPGIRRSTKEMPPETSSKNSSYYKHEIATHT